MTGEEWWESIRQARNDIASARNRLNAVREPLQAAQGSGGKNSTSDPTARVSMAEIDARASLESLLDDLGDLIAKGYAACDTIGRALGEDTALVMQLYYVDGERAWKKVAKKVGYSPRKVFELRKCAIDFTENVGIARLCMKDEKYSENMHNST